MKSSLARSILSTLSYHSKFNYPLTLDELHRFLLINRPLSPNELKPELDKLVKKEKIIKSSDFYYLSNSPNYPNFPNLPNIRLSRQKSSQPKLRLARRAARLIGLLPWIKLICVTGSLAMENSDPDDDIDLMIVTSQNRLWLTRPLAILLISLFFKRRRPHPHPSPHNSQLITHNNEICLNLWLDSSALAMPPYRQDLRTAHELAQMKPLVNKDQTYEKMLTENIWAKKFMANFFNPVISSRLSVVSSKLVSFQSVGPEPVNRKPINRKLKTENRKPITDAIFNFLNLFFFRLQFAYMKPKITSEEVALHSAFFHPKVRRTPPAR